MEMWALGSGNQKLEVGLGVLPCPATSLAAEPKTLLTAPRVPLGPADTDPRGLLGSTETADPSRHASACPGQTTGLITDRSWSRE